MKLEDVLIELNKVIPDCELRHVKYKDHSEALEKSYICGYNGKFDISIRVTQFYNDHSRKIIPSLQNKFLYEIEHRGSNIMFKYGNYDSLETYIYILKELIDFSILFSKRCSKFPDLPIEDNRNIKLSKLV